MIAINRQRSIYCIAVASILIGAGCSRTMTESKPFGQSTYWLGPRGAEVRQTGLVVGL
jgi:hypothetical protein